MKASSSSFMSSITVGAVLFAGLGVVAVPANAGDLLIAGTIGEVYQGDSETGGFELFGDVFSHRRPPAWQ